MIRILVIDDEPLALQQLAAYATKIPYFEIVGECLSAIEAREIMDNEQIDAIFVDINMPDINGMDFVRSLAAPPIVVFTTAYSEYAVDGYKVDAVDYLLKPFSLDDFRRAAMKVKKRYELENNVGMAHSSQPNALGRQLRHCLQTTTTICFSRPTTVLCVLTFLPYAMLRVCPNTLRCTLQTSDHLLCCSV